MHWTPDNELHVNLQKQAGAIEDLRETDHKYNELNWTFGPY